MMEPDVTQAMITHKSALIHIAVDSHDPTLARILPHRDVATVCENGFFIQIHRYHQLIIIDFAYKVFIVEITISVYQWLLAIFHFHHLKESKQLFTEHIFGRKK